MMRLSRWKNYKFFWFSDDDLVNYANRSVLFWCRYAAAVAGDEQKMLHDLDTRLRLMAWGSRYREAIQELADRYEWDRGAVNERAA